MAYLVSRHSVSEASTAVVFITKLVDMMIEKLIQLLGKSK